MAQAEEDRRRKALEERRQAQREATERCKMAISRLKGSSRSVNHHSRDIPLESMSKTFTGLLFFFKGISVKLHEYMCMYMLKMADCFECLLACIYIHVHLPFALPCF